MTRAVARAQKMTIFMPRADMQLHSPPGQSRLSASCFLFYPYFQSSTATRKILVPEPADNAVALLRSCLRKAIACHQISDPAAVSKVLALSAAKLSHSTVDCSTMPVLSYLPVLASLTTQPCCHQTLGPVSTGW